MKPLFRHGKWPQFWSRLHLYTIVSFILLVGTGVLLWVPALHAFLIPVLRPLLWIHVILGLVFAVTLLAPLLRQLPVNKTIRSIDWFAPMVLGSGIVLSGLVIWIIGIVPASMANAGFWWHGLLSALMSAWILVHAAGKAFGFVPFRNADLSRKVDPERRRFLTWLGWSSAGAIAVMAIQPGRLLRSIANSLQAGQPVVPTGSSFGAFYTVTGGYPNLSTDTFTLHVDGLVQRPQQFDWQGLNALKTGTETVDFHCVTGWSVGDVRWQGVSLQDLMKVVKPHQNAAYVHFYSADGVYTESLRMQDAMAGNVMLATHLNGDPLSQAQGYPLRLVVPAMYGYKSIKWVNRVAFSDKPLTGYWEARGYPDVAYVRTFHT